MMIKKTHNGHLRLPPPLFQRKREKPKAETHPYRAKAFLSFFSLFPIPPPYERVGFIISYVSLSVSFPPPSPLPD